MRLQGVEVDNIGFASFWYWINERQSIYLKKEAGEPWPWTTDEILQTYAFCNVFREQDKVTKQFRKLFERFADHPNLWFAYCLARQINWPDTVAEIMSETLFPALWQPNDVYDVMRARQARGEKLYTGAYMIRGDIQREGEDNNKPRYTVYRVLDPVWEEGSVPKFCDSLQSCTEYLSTFHGWAGFLSYEVATDLRHTRYLCNAPDIMTWANAGPGAKRGLNRIFGRPLTKGLSQEQALEEMRWLLEVSPGYTELKLEMRDIEHVSCEVDKYLRVKNGEGRPRAKYHRQVTI